MVSKPQDFVPFKIFEFGLHKNLNKNTLDTLVDS